MINLLGGILVAYLIGSVPTGYILIRLFKKVDIRNYGSGNIGATNVFRVGGKLLSVIVLILDALKGFICVALIAGIFFKKGFFVSYDLFKIILGLVAIAGHNWTIFLKFKGGKGVATSAGVFLGLAPNALLICALTWLGVFIVTRYVSLASIISVLIFPLAVYLMMYHIEFIIVSTVVAMLIVFKHKSNIYRLLRHEENKIKFK